MEKQYDFLIIGSGFGGSVSAMRLAQKGYSVAVLEAGKKWESKDFPKTNWNIRKYLWAPLIRCFGIQAISYLKGVMVLHGRGVGGGSLVYANTLMQPSSEVFTKDWPVGIDWYQELNPHYNIAKKMLGVVTNPNFFEAETNLKILAKKMNVEETFHSTEVGVYFGKPNVEVKDPYFGGQGPSRVGCISCGGCMVGCRYNSKNTLDKNYLYFAEKWGTKIIPEVTAQKIIPTANGYQVDTLSTTRLFNRKETFHAKNVVVAAGVLGTVELLLKNKFIYKTLNKISDQLGAFVRTNGESLLGATSFDKNHDFSKGIAIGAAFHPNPITKIEAVKYPKGSDFMRLLAVPLTESGTKLTRPLKLLKNFFLRFPKFLKLFLLRDWAQGTIILLVMQNIDQGMKLFLKGKSMRGDVINNNTIPSYIPLAQEAAKLLATQIKGEPQNIISEVLVGTPATAHILGGCKMSESEMNGVVDSNHQVFNYPGLYICDGSTVGANLGVNPSLTITALSERFTALIPIKDNEIYSSRKIDFH